LEPQRNTIKNQEELFLNATFEDGHIPDISFCQKRCRSGKLIKNEVELKQKINITHNSSKLDVLLRQQRLDIEKAITTKIEMIHQIDNMISSTQEKSKQAYCSPKLDLPFPQKRCDTMNTKIESISESNNALYLTKQKKNSSHNSAKLGLSFRQKRYKSEESIKTIIDLTGENDDILFPSQQKNEPIRGSNEFKYSIDRASTTLRKRLKSEVLHRKYVEFKEPVNSVIDLMQHNKNKMLPIQQKNKLTRSLTKYTVPRKTESRTIQNYDTLLHLNKIEGSIGRTSTTPRKERKKREMPFKLTRHKKRVDSEKLVNNVIDLKQQNRNKAVPIRQKQPACISKKCTVPRKTNNRTNQKFNILLQSEEFKDSMGGASTIPRKPPPKNQVSSQHSVQAWKKERKKKDQLKYCNEGTVIYRSINSEEIKRRDNLGRLSSRAAGQGSKNGMVNSDCNSLTKKVQEKTKTCCSNEELVLRIPALAKYKGKGKRGMTYSRMKRWPPSKTTSVSNKKSHKNLKL